MQYHAIPCNTMQYHASLITADEAYHCPVGSIRPFLKGEDARDFLKVQIKGPPSLAIDWFCNYVPMNPFYVSPPCSAWACFLFPSLHCSFLFPNHTPLHLVLPSPTLHCFTLFSIPPPFSTAALLLPRCAPHSWSCKASSSAQIQQYKHVETNTQIQCMHTFKYTDTKSCAYLRATLMKL